MPTFLDTTGLGAEHPPVHALGVQPLAEVTGVVFDRVLQHEHVVQGGRLSHGREW